NVSRVHDARCAQEDAGTPEGAGMRGATELAPPAQSSACPEGPERRRREGVNPMLGAVPRAGGPATSAPSCKLAALPSQHSQRFSNHGVCRVAELKAKVAYCCN